MSSPIWHTRRGFFGAFGAVAGIAFAACASNGNASAQQASPPTPRSTANDYRLGPADQLKITVFNEPGLTGQFAVGPQGTVAFPLVGDVQAAGLTVAEFTDSLHTKLQAYLRAPSVNVEVANYRPFFILGEVAHPGTYPYSIDLTVMNAVAIAGGFTYRANQHRVYIRHANETQEHALNLTVSTAVMPGDTVRIGERLF